MYAYFFFFFGSSVSTQPTGQLRGYALLIGVVAIDCHAPVHAFPELRIRQDSTIHNSPTQAMALQPLCVRLLSGTMVYNGSRPHSLVELRDKVAATIGCECDELSFCSGDAALLSCIEDANERITVVRDQVMGLLGEFLKHVHFELPEYLRPAREHRPLLLAALARDSRALQHASPELRADRDFVLAAVAIRGSALRHASLKLRSDHEVVLAAVAKNGCALHHASPELRADKAVVLAAVASNCYALPYASAELRGDRDVALAAVKRNGHALQYASPELRGDRDVVLAAVVNRGHALQYASPELRADRDVVLAAVARDGLAMQHASPELQADRAVVLAAVASNGHALRHASPELRADRAVVMAAVASNRHALQYALQYASTESLARSSRGDGGRGEPRPHAAVCVSLLERLKTTTTDENRQRSSAAYAPRNPSPACRFHSASPSHAQEK